MRNRALLPLAAIFSAAYIAGACGDNVENEMMENAVSEAMTPDPVDTVQAAALSNELVVAELDEWSIAIQPDTMSAGQITFQIHNRGSVEHAFEVERGDQEWEVDEIAPGEEAILNVELGPGTYEIYCPIEGDAGSHAELGMRTTLVVR